MKGEFKILRYGTMFWLLAANVKAALPTVSYAFPRINFSSPSSTALNYDFDDQLLGISTSPSTIQFASTESPVVISGLKTLQLNAAIDHSGVLLDSAENIFSFSGTVVRIFDGASHTYSGGLLTGRILEFDFQETGLTDQFEFLFQPTGGVLFNFFSPSTNVVLVTSESSTFDGSFTTAFSGRVKGVVSSTVVPEPSARSLFLCGMAVASLMLRRARCARKFALN